MKRRLLIVAATASLVIAIGAGYLYQDALIVGVLAAFLWLKKLFTLQGLLMLLKKMPLILLLGAKRLVIKISTHFLLFSAHLRFRKVRLLTRHLRVRAWLIKRRLKYHWQDLSILEKILAVAAALPLTIVLFGLMLVFVIPKAFISVLLNKTKEHSGAAVLSKTAQLGVNDKLVVVEKKIKRKIRQKLGPPLQ